MFEDLDVDETIILKWILNKQECNTMNQIVLRPGYSSMFLRIW
jgi:hypothetical protein